MNCKQKNGMTRFVLNYSDSSMEDGLENLKTGRPNRVLLKRSRIEMITPKLRQW